MPEALHRKSSAPQQAPMDISAVMEDLQAGLTAVLAQLPEHRVDLQSMMQQLGLRRTLAWKVVRMYRAPDALSCASHLPGPEGIEIIIAAAMRAGVPAETTLALRAAADRWFAMVGQHAPSRPELRQLVQGLAATATGKPAITQRRAAVEANSNIWGVRAAVHYNAAFLFDTDREASEGAVDAAIIKGVFGLVRKRPGITWELNRWVSLRADAGGKLRVPLTPEPLRGDEPLHQGVPLLQEFCSKPLADVRRSFDNESTIVDEVLAGSVGQSGAISLVTGERHKGMSDRYLESSDFQQGLRPRTPTDLLVAELHFERSLYPQARCEAYYYDLVCSALTFPNIAGIEPPRLHIEIDFAQYEAADKAPVIAEVPHHAAMRAMAYATIKRKPSDFVACIAKLRYPPVPGALVTHLPLPRRNAVASR